MVAKYTNFATSTLASGILAGDTSLTVFTGDGTKFPTLGAGEFFYAVLENLAGIREIIKVTARTGDTFTTIVRAQDSTTAHAWNAGDKVELRIVNANVSDYASSTVLATTGGAALVGYTQGGTGSVANTVQGKLRERISVKDFGAVGNGVTDDATAIGNAITAAAAVGGICAVDLAGASYAVSTSINIPTNVVLQNGKLVYTGNTANTAVVQIGITGGGTLVRPGGARNILVTTSSTAAGLVGFRMDSLVRSSFFQDCFASMNEDTAGTRGQVGFELIAERTATSPNTGCYENEITDCTAFNCNIGFRLKTRGTGAQQLADPQANANVIRGKAYACVRSALVIEEGAIENNIQIRADTFVTQTGLGTTIYVAEILGSQNTVYLDEEIGSRADTQYSIRLGPDSFWNNIEYKTQNVVTGKLKNDSTTGRNSVKYNSLTQSIGSELTIISWDTFSTAAIPDPSTATTRKVWLAPAPCTVVRCAANLGANLAGGTFTAYFAKNGVPTANNGISFTTGQGLAPKYIEGDPAAATPIISEFKLAKGDTMVFDYTAAGTGAVHVSSTCAVRFTSTDSNG